MIHIISQEAEFTTDVVMDWLFSLGFKVNRINGQSLDDKSNLTISISNDKINATIIEGNEVPEGDVAWYRRFGRPSIAKKMKEFDFDFESSESIFSTIKRDRQVLKGFLFNELEIKEWLNPPELVSMNKLKVLKLAAEIGLKIPPTIICTRKSVLLNFFSIHKELILKSISEVPFISNKKSFHTYLTHKIDPKDFEVIPENFVPSCFQKLIHKKYELRIFYLDGECYSMAIFSQKDSSTKVDFRNYNTKHPNRNVPYKLPNEISLKIKELMNVIGLNCGSIDIIKDVNGDYIFLEVNPVGQFGMVSRPCNYYLEKKVAESLITKNEKWKKMRMNFQ